MILEVYLNNRDTHLGKRWKKILLMLLKRNYHTNLLRVTLASHRQLLCKELTHLSCFLHPADQTLAVSIFKSHTNHKASLFLIQRVKLGEEMHPELVHAVAKDTIRIIL